MSVLVADRPIRSGCNFNAAGNPIVYKLLRSDSGYSQINNSGGIVQVQINGVDLTSFYQVGNSIYLEAFDLFYANSGTITASSFSGGNTFFNTTITYLGPNISGYIVNNSKRTDYKLEVEIFKSSDNSSLTNGVKFSYSPNSKGLMNVDVSAIVKTFLSAEWSNPVAINEVDAEASLKFYIKYQEYYDGALQGSVTDDSANPLHAVFAAMQIGSVNGQNMLSFYPSDNTKLWLTKYRPNSKLNKMVMWRDWPFDVSFIHPDAVGALNMIELRYDSSGALINSELSVLSTANDDSINRLLVQSPAVGISKLVIQLGLAPAQPAGYTDLISVPDDSFIIGIPGSWTNSGSVFDDPWSGGGGQVQATPDTDSRILTQTLPVNLRNRFLRLQFTANVPVGTSVIFALFVEDAGAGPSSSVIVGNGTPTSYSVYGYAVGTTLTTSKLGLRVTKTSGLTQAVIVQDVALTEGFISKQLQDLDIEVRDVCDYDTDVDGFTYPNALIHGRNPIHLFWKNSLGGDSFWNFQKYHEYTYTYQNGRKAKRIILFDTDLHPVQWESLQELNGTGEVYQTNIVELTSSVNKTSQRIGQQVYMLSQDGTKKTGVIVIPSTDRVFARDEVDKIAIEIELPEVFQI